MKKFIIPLFISILLYLFLNFIITGKKLEFLKDNLNWKISLLIKSYFFPHKLFEQVEFHKKDLKMWRALNTDKKLKIEAMWKDSNYITIAHDQLLKKNLNNLVFEKKESKKIMLFEKEYELSIFKTPLNQAKLMRGINNRIPGSAYLFVYDGKIFMLSALGIFAYAKLDDMKKLINFKQIKNNIDSFLSLEKIPPLPREFSVKDLSIINDKIYISLNFEEKLDCWKTIIIFADLNYKELNFKKFFVPESRCNGPKNDLGNPVEAHQSGGKILRFDDESIIFTTGDWRNRYRAQDLNFDDGKIIKINLTNKKKSFLAMGTRNSQGILVDRSKNIVLFTEHGPMGGDEINLLDLKNNKIQNFGWPNASYGEHYGGKTAVENKKKYEKYPLKKNHKKYNFIEPLKYFEKSPAMSEIIQIEKNKYIATSMKYKSLYPFSLASDNSLKKIEKIYIGERIRDAIISDKTIYLFLEDTASIGVLK
jgi:hypothetical protein